MEDGQPLGANTVLELLENATQILLTSIIRWGRVVAALKEDLWQTGLQGEQSEEATTDLRIESCRSPPVVEGLVSTLREAHPDLSITAHDLAGWLSTVPTEHSKNGDDTKIAVVGMSCRLPGGGDDLEHFWQILEEGQDAHHQHVPADRYDVQTHTDPTGRRPNTSQTPFGCFVDNPGLFDASFFDMSPREAGQTDPTHRLALLTAYEALENSGYVPDRTFSTTRQTVGTIYGQCSDDYREANAGQEIDMYFIPGNYRAFAPGRISYFFKFSGSSFSCDTACSASLAAVQIACAALGHGEANMVVAGGLNIITSSDSFAGLSRAYFLSKTGGCKVFDDGADGYCRADGVGSLVLKRLPDAQKDNDKILGVILATGTNHSSAAVSLTHPHAPTQERLYRSVLSEAGISPLDVDLVEMHGTGTQAGDAAEMESVTNVFSPSDGRGARRSETLHIGSVKANLGHGEAAAGVTALIKALLILKHNAIPKHVGIKTQLNSKFPDLERLNVHIPTDTIPWPRRADRKRYIMVNNFSAAGGNTSLVVAEPPERPPPEPRGWPGMGFVVCVSAKSGISLHRNLKRLIAYIEDHSTSIHLPSLSYTSTARRIHHVHRIAVHGCSIEEVLKSLRLRLPETTDAAKQRAMPVGAMAAPRIAFVFSGQGSFYTGISRALVEHYPPYKKEIQRLDRLCLLHGFPSILPGLELGGHDVANLTPIVAQLTTVCVQVALYRLWTSLGVAPHIVIGASIGEYAALHAAGALSASEIIYLVGHRALLMQELCTANTHTMLAVQATVEQVRQCVHDSSLYEVACVNSPNSITLAGTIANIDAMKISLESQGYRTAPLNVAYAFHSSHIEPTIDRFDALAVRVSTRPLKIPLISPLLRDTIYAGQELPETYLRDATRQTVHFWEALENACEQDLIPPKTAFVEIGIHPTYSSAVRAIVPDTAAIVSTLRSDEDNWNTLTGSMAKLYEAGVHLGWNELYKPYESELRLLDLPTYQWNLKNYWIQHNGDWLLTKDRPPCTSDSAVVGKRAPAGLRSPLVHRIVEEDFSSGRAKVVVESDAHDDEFFAVASAHKMSGRPVVSVVSKPVPCHVLSSWDGV
jgi:acyl transferase domain-containing protein